MALNRNGVSSKWCHSKSSNGGGHGRWTGSTLVAPGSASLYRLALSFIVIPCTIFGLTACGKSEVEDPRSKTSLVSVEGSDTMKSLLDAWQKGFMDSTQIPVSVTTADSGGGIQSLLDRTTDVAAASRGLTEKESKLSHERKIHLERKIVALDSIAIIVNKENPVDSLTYSELADLFNGKVDDWSSLSKDSSSKNSASQTSQKVQVCVREPASGTSRYFREHVFSDLSVESKTSSTDPFVDTAKVVLSHEDMIAAVSEDRNSIGFVGLGDALQAERDGKLKIVKLKLLPAAPPVMPTLEAATNDYPLSRPLYLFYDKNAKKSARQFIEFCTGPDGQEIAKKEGFAVPPS